MIHPTIWAMLCADGSVHGDRKMEERAWVCTGPFADNVIGALDSAYTCGPHRIVAYVPAVEAGLELKQKGNPG